MGGRGGVARGLAAGGPCDALLLADADDPGPCLVSEQEQQRDHPHQPVPAGTAVGSNRLSGDRLIHACSLKLGPADD